MLHAYQEIYLSSAMSSMGEAFDYAVNDCKIPGGDFVKMLIVSPACSRIENGEPAYLAGKSGIEIARKTFPETNLKRFRSLYGCSQSELSKLSGVSLRSIQMYEQRQKDINKASVDTVRRLAKVLGCTVEDLVEK
ncbi:MAG: helix-turn-helix transcriptional regulator [Oscillospiraceae bacterium]|nr:helix-turn-helix transcriptional regulator [Oscillospiraceae bacterium]